MVQRCTNPNREDYQQLYRNVGVCERWRRSFAAFLEDMGVRPGPEYTLGRLRSSEPYCPENCEWQTKPEQVASSRKPDRTYTRDGVTFTYGEWAELLGVKRATLIKRIERGWGELAFVARTRQRRTTAARELAAVRAGR